MSLRKSLLIASIMALPMVVSAGLLEDDEARRAILELRQKVDEQSGAADKRSAALASQIGVLQQQQSADASAQRQALMDLLNQLETLRSDMAKLRGQNEQLARDISDLQRQFRDAGQITDERFRRLEPFQVTVDGQSFNAQPSEKKEFEAALATLRKGDFEGAQTAFGDFLNRYGGTGYKPSALFWLGNAQYALKNYKEAIATLRLMQQASSTHVRVPDALLTIANCQLETKDTKAAKKTLQDLMADYPSAEAAAIAKDRLAKIK